MLKAQRRLRFSRVPIDRSAFGADRAPTFGDLVDLRFEIGREWPTFRRGKTVGELFWPARADDWRGDGRIREHPANGQSSHAHVGLFGNMAKLFNRLEFPFVPITRLVHRTRAAEREARTGR